jgi:hypothetical protein
MKHHIIKTYGGVKVELRASLISAVNGVSGELNAPAKLSRGRSVQYLVDRRLDGNHK